MSQCVPSWDLDDNHTHPRLSNSNSTAPDVPMLDYEVAELTWENGQVTLHGLGAPRVPTKPFTNWDKPRATGTLESIVNQATRLPEPKPTATLFPADELVPWFRAGSTAANSATMTMDALVPCSNDERTTHVIDSVTGLGGTCVVGSSTRVGSCSGPAGTQDEGGRRVRTAARVAVAGEWSGRDQSVSGSATFGITQPLTFDTYERDVGVGYTSTSMGSPENTSSAKLCAKPTTTDDHDSVCHSRSQRDTCDEEEKKLKARGKSSASTKRSRAAAIHNQSERKRRDKINQRMKTLQKLVPNSSKTDKASMLDEVIEYLKQLQAQVHMMSRMSMSPMMMPMTMQQQLQMSMMAPMGLGMGMGMMDITRPNIPPVLPNPFIPIMPWDPSLERSQPASTPIVPDPLSAFLSCHSQPMSMDVYGRMAAMYQQLLQQPPISNSKT